MSKRSRSGLIKRTQADVWFSKCVRARANWTCENCGINLEHDPGKLTCSHHHTRGNWAVRFDPLNAEALCFGCHDASGGTERRRVVALTQAQRMILKERADSLSLGRMFRETNGKGAISKHFKAEFEAIQWQRNQGQTHRIDFRPYLQNA